MSKREDNDVDKAFSDPVWRRLQQRKDKTPVFETPEQEREYVKRMDAANRRIIRKAEKAENEKASKPTKQKKEEQVMAKRKRFDDAKKKEVVDYTKDHTVKDTSTHFGISAATINNWKGKKSKSGKRRATKTVGDSEAGLEMDYLRKKIKLLQKLLRQSDLLKR